MPKFLDFHFKGGRYDIGGGGIPLSVLPNLAKLDKLARSVARDLFFTEQAERLRVSAGFDSAFIPRITKIEGGGSCDLEVDYQSLDTLFSDEAVDAFEEAGPGVVELIEILNERPLALPNWASNETFEAMADVLEDVLLEEGKEAVDVKSADGRTALCTPEVQGRAKEASVRVLPRGPQDYHVVGRVYQVNTDSEDVAIAFLREGEEGRKRQIPVSPEIADSLLLLQRQRTIVRLNGRAERVTGGRLQLHAAKSFDTIGGPSIFARVAELSDVTEEWDDEESPVPIKSLLRHVSRSVWTLIGEFGWARPCLFPDTEGGVDALWKDDRWTNTLRFASAREISFLAADRVNRKVLRSHPVTTVGDLIPWIREHLAEIGGV